MTLGLRYFSDSMRHLVCHPYNVENLHNMAADLGIGGHWFHGGRFAHYDIPKRRIAEVRAKTERVGARAVLAICKGGLPPCEVCCGRGTVHNGRDRDPCPRCYGGA